MEIAGYERSGDWNQVWSIARQSYWLGETIVVHCMAGRHRGATVAALMYALLHETSWEQAVAHIEARRPEVDFAGFMRNRKAAAWIHEVLRTTRQGGCLSPSDRLHGNTSIPPPPGWRPGWRLAVSARPSPAASGEAPQPSDHGEAAHCRDLGATLVYGVPGPSPCDLAAALGGAEPVLGQA